MKELTLIEKIVFEGDYKTFTHHGLKCFIHRNDGGALCGYVDVENNLIPDDITAHGDINYRKGSIIGFDCGHACDFLPSLNELSNRMKKDGYPFLFLDNLYKESNYKTMDFVKFQCKKLADQIYFHNREMNRYIKLAQKALKGIRDIKGEIKEMALNDPECEGSEDKAILKIWNQEIENLNLDDEK